jgi:tRNA threonylcarbamoyladenosine biosynthesis protein TsaB
MKLLTLDTSSDACSCALTLDGEILEHSVIAPRQHTTLILPMIAKLLAEAGLTPTQLDGIAFGCGPGSFTGLRIAGGITQGIAFAADIPVAPISCLATLAQGAYLEQGIEKVLAAIDARMNEVYFAKYLINKEQIMQLVDEEIVTVPLAIPLPPTVGWYGIGSGWATYTQELTTHCGDKIQGYQGEKYPQARAIIPLAQAAFAAGQIVSAEDALPVYLRNRVV